MHVTNTFEHILAHHMLQFFKYAILLFDAKDIISLFLVSVTDPVKLYRYITTLNQLIVWAVNVVFKNALLSKREQQMTHLSLAAVFIIMQYKYSKCELRGWVHLLTS